MHGSRAVAEGVKLCDVKVIAAYPITPQTHIVEDLAKFVADGELDCEYIMVESEHSAMSATIGASATGARTFTATASQGLALMHEMLFIASGMRLPIVMVNANRALSAPINIWNDQGDSMAQRDSGWIQLYVETNQEAIDTTIQAYKISENTDVLLPTMVCMDGFVLTHTVEPVEIPDKKDIDKFLPPYVPEMYLDPNDPMTQGAFADPSTFTEFRYAQEEGMRNALEVIKEVDKEYQELTGRGYGIIEDYNTKDGEIVLVSLGSVVGTIKEVIDELKEEVSVGILKIKLFRPFPEKEILEALKNAKVVSVIEKDVSIGMGQGALYNEVKAALYNSDISPKTLGFIAGLGGRDVTLDNIREVISLSQTAMKKDVPEVTWVGLKG
ncbi:MAG: pyruvate synthase subunit PorA [Candidatus Hydrothermarchaeales archaeon]